MLLRAVPRLLVRIVRIPLCGVYESVYLSIYIYIYIDIDLDLDLEIYRSLDVLQLPCLCTLSVFSQFTAQLGG